MIRPALILACLLTTAPASGQDVGPSNSKALAAALQPFVDRHELAGAVVLVSDKDRTLALATVGFADIDARRPMAPDTVFWIASQTKPITASVVMMLVDEGKLRLDDPVAKYLPEFADVWLASERDADHVLLKRPSRPITIRDILSHTSGLPFASPLETPTLDGLPLAVAVRSYAVTPLQFDPGTKYAYSNAGINTAARVLEVVSGKPYETFLQERLLDPLGMKDTTFWPSEAQLKRLAEAYKPAQHGGTLEKTTIGQLRYPLSDRSRHPMPAGGLFSTAEDVARFCRMLLNGGTHEGKRLLSEGAIKEMARRQTAPSIRESYGLGLSVNGDEFGHGGALATDMTIDARRGLITVYLIQHAGFRGRGGEAQGAFRKAADEAFGARDR